MSNDSLYLPSSVTFHLLSGSPACMSNVLFVMFVLLISSPAVMGRMKAASQLPVVRQSFISPLLSEPVHSKTMGSASEAVNGVGSSMLHPLGVASPTINKVEVLMGRLPSMILRSFSPSQLASICMNRRQSSAKSDVCLKLMFRFITLKCFLLFLCLTHCSLLTRYLL